MVISSLRTAPITVIHIYCRSSNTISQVLSKNGAIRILLDSLILDHPRIYSSISTLNANDSLGCFSIKNIVVIAVRTILIALLVLRHVLPERLLALLAHERHFNRPGQLVRLRLGVAFCAVVPLFAARRTDGDLRVQDVFAHSSIKVKKSKVKKSKVKKSKVQEKRLANMVNFIAKEAQDKASEIELKAQEECDVETAKLVQTQKQKISQEFERKEKQVLVNKKIARSNETSRSRLTLLKARETGVNKIFNATREKLAEISSRPNYKDLVVKLILQALRKIEETEVEVRCREEDVKIVQEAIPIAAAEYKKMTEVEVTLKLDTKYPLPPSPKNAGPKALNTCAGGIILSARGGRILCNNTLDARLQYGFEGATPKIRHILFKTEV